MTEAIRLNRATFFHIDKTDFTPWTFGEITDVHGRTALIELLGSPRDVEIARLIQQMLVQLRGQAISSEQEVEARLGQIRAQARDRVLSTAVSSLRTAVFAFQVQSQQQSLNQALGATQPPAKVPLYANLNRPIRGHGNPPSLYAQTAEVAVTKGFTALKCAPFEEVQPDSDDAALENGFERIAAILSAVGPEITLLVDCHSRFNRDTALRVGHRFEALGIGWYEEPLEPCTDAAALTWLKRQLAIPIAGGESGYGVDFFDRLIAHQAVDIIMPDVKYCGGVFAAYQAGQEALKQGGSVSLHCPTGPVSAVTSAHVTAALSTDWPLEFALHEVPWRAELIHPPERVEDGYLCLPQGVGLGIVLNQSVIEKYGRVLSH